MAKKEIIIGSCVILALAVLYFGIEYLKGVNLFKPANYYSAMYTDVAGLQKSAPVTLNGLKVGQVSSIGYEYKNPGHVLVEMSLDKELRIPRGSKAVIEQDLLGTATVVLHMSDATEYQAVGSRLDGETATGLMGTVSQQLMPSVSAIFPKIDTLLTSVNALAANPALAASVTRLDAITLNIDRTIRQLNAAVATLPATASNINTVSANLTTMTDDLSQFTGKINAIPVDSLADNLTALSANLRQLSTELNNPNSTLGALTHDRELYNNLNAAAASLDSLLIDAKRNPKRYISIKLL